MPGTSCVHADAGETLLLRLPVPAGHGLQLGDVRQRGRQRLRGRHRHLPRHGLARRLEHGAPGLLGAAGRNREAALRSFRRLNPRLVQQSAGTLDLYSMQIRASAFEGESVSVTDLLADSLALTGSATLDGLTAQGNVGCDQLLCNDVNCTDVFTTGVDASGAVSCAALTATGTVAGATLSSTGAVSGSSLSITGAASVGQHTHHQQHGQRRELHHGGRRVHGDVDGGCAGPLDCESLDCTFTATSGGVSTGSVVCGDATSSGTVSAPQLFASNTLIVTNTSDFSDDLFLTKNWAGWSKLQISNNSATSDSGPELRLLGASSS